MSFPFGMRYGGIDQGKNPQILARDPLWPARYLQYGQDRKRFILEWQNVMRLCITVGGRSVSLPDREHFPIAVLSGEC
jgi:hypothetical protein